jgi:cation transporter-like permease
LRNCGKSRLLIKNSTSGTSGALYVVNGANIGTNLYVGGYETKFSKTSSAKKLMQSLIPLFIGNTQTFN